MSIYFEEKTKTFYLESKDISYIFCVTQWGFLNHLYYGKRIAREDLRYGVAVFRRVHECVLPNDMEERIHCLNVYANECPTYGRGDYRESMLSFMDVNGSRLSDLVYESYKIYQEKPALNGLPSVRGKETLAISLRDTVNGSKVTLYYTVFEDLPVILRHAEIENIGKEALVLNRAYSFSVDMPESDWEAISLHGAHNRERFLERTAVHHGQFVIDSKRCTSSSQTNPFLAIVHKDTNETSGVAYGYNFVYSGDFVFKAEVNPYKYLRVTGGINDYDFSWKLACGEKFVTPEMVMVYSENGLGKMSRIFHDLYREYLINPRFVNAPRPIVINNWEATRFDFDTDKICSIIKSVKDTGIDMFVLDDGWFGARDNEYTGLGDWYINEKKLPQGLKPIIDCAHKNNMKFGLWFEPEMVNPDSELYRKHPDWIIRYDKLEPCFGRNQYILDLTRVEVRDYIVECISKILRENEIDYVKWDMNRVMTENYSSFLKERSIETHHRYILGVYDICERLVNGFPKIFFEGCASGGGRFDPGMLYYFPQIWTSDDTDAYMRTIIQSGTSMCYPVSSMSCHVSVSPNQQCGRITPLKSRGDIAQLGATGYELDTTKCEQEEIAEIARQVQEYKKIEDLVLFGDLYRLSEMRDSNVFAHQLVSKDKKKAVLVAMRGLVCPSAPPTHLYPQGLEENTTYYIPELDLARKGSVLMNYGILVEYPRGDFTTVRYTFITKEKEEY